MFGIFKKDPEIERIVARLYEQLDDIEDWYPIDDEKIKHRLYNISISQRHIQNPNHVWIPSRWRRMINKKIKQIYRRQEVDELCFIYDVIDGKYPYYIYQPSDEQKEWLEENAKSSDYMIIDGYSSQSGLYFIDAEIAMAFKIVFTD